MMRRFAAIALLLIAASCKSADVNMQSFETVWQTVNERHFDPTFDGLDWQAMHDRYKPQIASAKKDQEVLAIINKMLFELNLSHLLVVSPEDVKKFLPNVFAEGTVGIDLRMIDGAAIVTSVKKGSTAAEAGLKSGHMIQRIEGRTVEAIIAEAEPRLIPPFNERNRRNNLSRYVLGHIYGPPDTSVNIVFLDEQDRQHKKTINRRSRGRGRILSEALPPFFVEFEAKRLQNHIGYVRFNHFSEPVDEEFIRALNKMADISGLIIDLRGNPGGFFKTSNRLTEHLIYGRTLFYNFGFRDKKIDVVLDRAAEAYKGPMVVLVDVTSTSASEHFAGCMRAIDRAAIVGEQTPGYLLVANWKKLPNGAAFMYTVGQTHPADGAVIEGHGVKPDIDVQLDRRSLLRGIDTQLEAAITYLSQG